MLDALLLAALLSVRDPAGDAFGKDLVAPTATLFRQREAFDIRGLEVLAGSTVTLQVALGRVEDGFPQPLLELYVSDAEVAGTQDLLTGSQLRLPPNATWRYAFRVVGETVRVFSAQDGARVDVTEASSARLSVTGDTLTLTTRLPLPRRFSVYGMSGSYDPFSPDGWRTPRRTPSPWGFSGTASSPVLDVIADTPEVQERALAQGVLPEIRASFAQPGWLSVAGVGVAVALTGVAARLYFGRRVVPERPAAQLAPLSEKDIRHHARMLKDLARGQGTLTAAGGDTMVEEAPALEPVMK
ncbi:MAG: hypothetical protein AVDCRST_MAG86-2882 [uncultured Truepera sp.]|uniref:Glucodextranase-like C-terminal domain-containing protein n=1 Tax=uncultured Truepera sp. TaxID=543023 RepID=A0A6J4VK40_9DEIN|nr:MAG: hypothetical protein AVDCRST_MAG86-2882 [uncultured Truepera sp.]